MDQEAFNDQNHFDPRHENRSYRQQMKSPDLIPFQVIEKESDLFIQASANLEDEARIALRYYRSILENYIKENPSFKTTLKPYPPDEKAPPVIQEMIEVSAICNVGPMAAVAGCISENVAQHLLQYTDDLIIENGGDLYLKSPHIRKVIIYAGFSPLSNRIVLQIDSREKGMGICTSSGTVGPSFSMGKADSVTVLSGSAALADAAATTLGNLIQKKEDIEKGLNCAKTITGLTGVVMIIEDRIGMWGEVNYHLI